MTKKALLASLLILGAPAAVLAHSHSPPGQTPGVSDTYIFPGSSSQASMSEDVGGYGGVGSSSPGGMQSTDIVYRLQQAGYSDVSDLRPTLGGYTALAVKDGKVMQVEIDNSGKVTRLR